MAPIRRTLRRPTLVSLLGAALATAPGLSSDRVPEPPASEPADAEEILFRLVYQGKEGGEERFRISEDRERGQLRIRGRAKLRLGVRSFDLTQDLRVDEGRYSLISYEMDAVAGNEKQRVRAFRDGDSVVVEAQAPGGRIRRAIHEPKDVWIVDPLSISHLDIVSRHVASRGFRPDTLRVFLPQAGVILDAPVVPRPVDPKGARAIEIRIGESWQILRLDPAGNLARVEIPAQKIAYERIAASAADGTAKRRGNLDRPREPILEAVPDPARMLYDEQTVEFVSAGLALQAIFALPRGGHRIPYAGVLFLHDAGPMDRDGRDGPYRPFQDLARGLAVFGIASLRYDKGSLVTPDPTEHLDAESTEAEISDAIAALETLRSRSGIDSKAIVLVALGEGCAQSFSIARRGGSAAGFVLLDPPERTELAERLRVVEAPTLVLRSGRVGSESAPDSESADERIESGMGGVLVRSFPELGPRFAPGEDDPTVDPAVIAEIADFIASLR